MRSNADNAPAHFKTMQQANVPQGRQGKHKEIVTTILHDLDMLKIGSAIKVPLSELSLSKEKVRSALNRATRKAGRTVATASDADFLYVWNVAASPKKP
jgi:DNA helicase TIP49 (TBP-interacting protein)